MTRDRSLDEFLGADDEEPDSESAPETTEEDSAEEESAGETTREESAGETTDEEPAEEESAGETSEKESAGETSEEPPAEESARETSTSEAPTDGATGEASGHGGEEPADSAPASVTYEWSSDGGVCARCGETVRRRWRTGAGADETADVADGDGRVAVCADCKDW